MVVINYLLQRGGCFCLARGYSTSTAAQRLTPSGVCPGTITEHVLCVCVYRSKNIQYNICSYLSTAADNFWPMSDGFHCIYPCCIVIHVRVLGGGGGGGGKGGNSPTPPSKWFCPPPPYNRTPTPTNCCMSLPSLYFQFAPSPDFF